MINRTRHTRRKQTLSTLFQLEVTSNRPRLTRSLSAETDISTLHKNPPTVTLGGNRLTSLPSSLHTWRIQTCQLCAKTVSTHPAETDIVNFTPSGNINGMINRTPHMKRKQTLSTLFQQEVTRGTPRLTRSLSADSDISTVHKNPATATLGGNSLTPRGSHGHSRLIQTLQLCNGSIQRTFLLLSAHPADLARATDRFVCCCNVPLG